MSRMSFNDYGRAGRKRTGRISSGSGEGKGEIAGAKDHHGTNR